MQNAKHAMQNAKPRGVPSGLLILSFAFPVSHFALHFSWRSLRLGGGLI
jgi:hypothetical protein